VIIFSKLLLTGRNHLDRRWRISCLSCVPLALPVLPTEGLHVADGSILKDRIGLRL
jgi:hypothetical protein